MMNRKLAGGVHRVLRKSPVVVAFLCAVLLAFVSFYNSNKLQGHHGMLRVGGTRGLRQVYEPESFRLVADHRYLAANAAIAERVSGGIPPAPSSENTVKSLKELIRDAVDRGLVVIVNASDTDAARVLADHWHGGRLDISGALDGPMGEILVEVMQELRNMEDLASEIAELKRKIKRYEQEKEQEKGEKGAKNIGVTWVGVALGVICHIPGLSRCLSVLPSCILPSLQAVWIVWSLVYLSFAAACVGRMQLGLSVLRCGRCGLYAAWSVCPLLQPCGPCGSYATWSVCPSLWLRPVWIVCSLVRLRPLDVIWGLVCLSFLRCDLCGSYVIKKTVCSSVQYQAIRARERWGKYQVNVGVALALICRGSVCLCDLCGPWSSVCLSCPVL